MLVLKIRFPRARQAQLVPVRKFPFTLGRSLDCDYVVDEPHWDARHLQVDIQAGKIWVRDCDSVNGMVFNGDRLRQLQVAEGTKIDVGPVHIEFLLSEPALQPAQAYHYASPREKKLLQPVGASRLRMVMIAFCGFLAACGVDYWLNDFWIDWSSLLGLAVMGTLVGTVLTLAAAGQAKIHNKEYRFFPIFYYVFSGMAVFVFSHALIDHLLAVFSDFYLREVIFWMVLLAIISAFVIRVAKVIFSDIRPARVQAYAGGLVILLGILVITIRTVQYKNRQFYQYSAPINFNFSGVFSGKSKVDDLLILMDRSHHKLAEYRLERLKEKKEIENERKAFNE